MKVFKTTFLVYDDPEEAIENGERNKDKPLTTEEVREYLNNALLIDWDREGQGDPIGIQGMEVVVEDLEKWFEDNPHEAKGTHVC
jgi:hypothetical protein